MPADIVNVHNQKEFEEVLSRTLAPGTEIHLKPDALSADAAYRATQRTPRTIVVPHHTKLVTDVEDLNVRVSGGDFESSKPHTVDVDEYGGNARVGSGSKVTANSRSGGRVEEIFTGVHGTMFKLSEMSSGNQSSGVAYTDGRAKLTVNKNTRVIADGNSRVIATDDADVILRGNSECESESNVSVRVMSPYTNVIHRGSDGRVQIAGDGDYNNVTMSSGRRPSRMGTKEVTYYNLTDDAALRAAELPRNIATDSETYHEALSGITEAIKREGVLPLDAMKIKSLFKTYAPNNEYDTHDADYDSDVFHFELKGKLDEYVQSVPPNPTPEQVAEAEERAFNYLEDKLVSPEAYEDKLRGMFDGLVAKTPDTMSDNDKFYSLRDAIGEIARSVPEGTGYNDPTMTAARDKGIQLLRDNGLDPEKHMDVFMETFDNELPIETLANVEDPDLGCCSGCDCGKACAQWCEVGPVCDEYAKQDEADTTFYALGESAARMAGALTDEDDREQVLMDARSDAVQEICARGLQGDEEQRAMDMFDEALGNTLNSYDVRNMTKPIVSDSGELNPGIYSVDDDVFRIGDTGAMSQFRHGAWRPVRASGAKQDSEYKLKRRGAHTKESLLKTLGKTSESCLLCGKPLEDDDSIARGVGSSCAQKYGIR